MRTLLKDARDGKWTLLQITVAIVDHLMNPRATDYPFAYTEHLTSKEKPSQARLIVRRFVKDGKLWYWYVRF